jgi:phosphoribosylformylglycinamidine (FGAM) synthase-like enzyme/phosphoribosylformylglycinamidine (FGAM) synthase PurS component
VTVYQIEVRAVAGRHDVQAQRLAREILHIPLARLPSLAAIPTNSTPLTIRTAHLYRLIGTLTTSQIDQLTKQLLVDTVIQEARDAESAHDSAFHIVDVFFHPGVTDTLAESVLAGTYMLGIPGLERVETGQRHLLDGRLSESDVRTITEALLYNPVIQQYTLQLAGTTPLSLAPVPTEQLPTDKETSSPGTIPLSPTQVPTGVGSRFIVGPRFIAPGGAKRHTRRYPSPVTNTIPLSAMTEQQLLELSKTSMLALELHEMQAIQQYYKEQGREPTDVELETLAQTWSEHCSHKTFKATIDYREVDADGNVLQRETISSLLRQYIMRATEVVERPWVVSAFRDNAGIVRFTDSQDIAFKVETHNHPSAIEPFGGANTGVGGVIRDVLGVSAQPIACTDILCFGPPDTPAEELSAGVLAPRRVASGVVNGVRDYGNKMGIPIVNGAILYHSGYIYNPLVFCGCLGALPHGSHPNQVQPGDQIVVLGGRTGRDGIHGATFSSGEMSDEINAQAGSAVQIGAPITEKKVVDVIIQARQRQLYHAITDCGAGGFSSAIGEMGAQTGAWVELTHAPLKYQGLAPWEIWLSEAQERMVLAVPPEHLEELLALCAIEEVEASIIGTFTNDHRLAITYNGQFVADIDMDFLHKGRPHRTLEAVWISPQTGTWDASKPTAYSRGDPCGRPVGEDDRPKGGHGRPVGENQAIFSPALLALLSHPTIASKEMVVRRYDHEVQAATVLKPLVGLAGNGPGDAAVLQPILDEPTRMGVIVSNGINPLYGKIDPYAMAMNAVDEALRNLTAVGGDVEHAAILDNFCWGNPSDPVQLGMLVRAVKGCHDAAVGFGTPFISGKDSLNNEYRAEGKRLPVIPTLLISAVGVIDDAAQTIDMSLKDPGNLLYQVGATRNELAGSHYMELLPTTGLPAPQAAYHEGTLSVPQVDVATARATMKALGAAIRQGLVQACHDLSEGGLAVAAAEMSLAGLLGMDIDVGKVPHIVAPRFIAGARFIEGNSFPVENSFSDAINTLLLFSESASRFLVEVAPAQRDAFETHLRIHGIQHFACIGAVAPRFIAGARFIEGNSFDRFIVRNGEQMLIDVSVARLQEAWKEVKS